MKIGIVCSKCGVRFTENQTVAKVDNSKPFEPDVAYYCIGHVPKGECVTAKAHTWQRQLLPEKRTVLPANIRKVCKECGKVFMAESKTRKYCSLSCSSRTERKRKR